MKKVILTKVVVLVALFFIVGFAFFLADVVRTDESARAIVESYGYIGILVTAIVAGLNFVVPVPAAAFTPVFLEAGFSWFTIIALLVIGTLLADTIGYFLGRAGRQIADEDAPWVNRMESFIEKRPRLVVPVVFLYASFMPLPNELILIPLGLAGHRFVTLILPLLLGNVVHQTLVSLGFSSVFSLLF